MFGPTDLKQIDLAIQAGRGAAASVLGQTYDVYRLSSASNGSILDGEPVITGYQGRLRRITDRKAIEADPLELIVAEFTLSNVDLELGDILVETGYESDGGRWCFAQARPTRESLFVRCEELVQIYRPRVGNLVPTGTPNAATPGAPFVSSTFASSDVSTRESLSLTDGVYNFSPPNIAAADIPIGIQMTARAGGTRANALPSSSATARFVGYIPPLPGITINSDDVLYLDDDHSYIVNSALQEAPGFQGTVMVLELMGD
jgi:hypothetical protein